MHRWGFRAFGGALVTFPVNLRTMRFLPLLHFPDVDMLSPAIPGASIGLAEGPGGTLWAAVPDNMPADSAMITFVTSSDGGVTWTTSPTHVPGPGVATRVRLVGNGTNLYCLYIFTDTVHIFNVNTQVVNRYEAYTARDFDCVLRPGGWLYLFVEVRNLDDIRRAGTVDGGATWTGNTALVTGSGQRPRVTMSAGDTLILNYYGPPLPDVTKSIVRAGRYQETSPGTLSTTASAFQDVLTDTQVDKWGFRSVIHAGRVWLAWSEGPFNSREVKCRVSLDNGTTYGTAFDVFATPGLDELLADLQAISGPNGSGVGMAVVRYQTPGQNDPQLDQVYYSSALASMPTTFAPEVGISEHAPTFVNGGVLPQLVHDASGVPGICWVGLDAGGTTLWYDAGAISTGLPETGLLWLEAWPVPASDRLTVSVPGGGRTGTWEVLDASGRPVNGAVRLASTEPLLLDVSRLATGSYLVRTASEEGVGVARFLVAR